MADIDTIWELLQDVDGKCDELLTFKTAHEEYHRGLSRQFADMQTTLWDKGDGLTYRIQRIELNGKSRKSAARLWRGLAFGILRTVASAAIIGLAAWLLCMYIESRAGL